MKSVEFSNNIAQYFKDTVETLDQHICSVETISPTWPQIILADEYQQ